MKEIKWPTDEELFILRQAARDLRFLLARGYAKNSAITFVGNHYQLGKLYRNLLFRAVFPRDLCLKRRQKRLKVSNLLGQKLLVDGYNCFITLESALKGMPIIRCDDGFVRDISGVFRSFVPSDTTARAWELMKSVFTRYTPKDITFFLDAPYSNSGEFCAQIRNWLYKAELNGDCVLLKGPEREMGIDQGVVITGDSIIIEASAQVFDLTGHIVSKVLRICPLWL